MTDVIADGRFGDTLAQLGVKHESMKNLVELAEDGGFTARKNAKKLSSIRSAVAAVEAGEHSVKQTLLRKYEYGGMSSAAPRDKHQMLNELPALANLPGYQVIPQSPTTNLMRPNN